MGKKQLSGAMKRKKKKEKVEAIAEAAAEIERLKLGPSKLWTGLMTHHRDIFVSHVLPKLNRADRYFFAEANTESLALLKYAGIDESELHWSVYQCTSISTLELIWVRASLGKKLKAVQAMFCSQVACTNKLELLKWVREVKNCEWDEWTTTFATDIGNLMMLKYCLANGCPYDEQEACQQAAGKGHLDCLRFFVDKVKPSQATEKEAAKVAATYGQLDILKYFVEERNISRDVNTDCVLTSVFNDHLDCLKYMVEEAKARLHDNWLPIAYARYFKRTECLHYLREKGCPEPTDEEYASYIEGFEPLSGVSEQNE